MKGPVLLTLRTAEALVAARAEETVAQIKRQIRPRVWLWQIKQRAIDGVATALFYLGVR